VRRDAPIPRNPTAAGGEAVTVGTLAPGRRTVGAVAPALEERMSPSTPDHRRPSSRLGGPLRAAVLAIVVALAASACLPLVSPATSGHQYGTGPLESIWEAAQAQSKCAGLTSAELAVMMMVPTYPEAGTPIPAPMALGRWDNLSVSSNNSRLFAFGQTSGPYVNAYFSAGVGMWQFDSAGGWDLTAADAIDTLTAARQAASTIAYRYCNPPSSVARDDASLRRYAWGPWFGCSTGSSTSCETVYASLYKGEQLDVRVDDRVGRFGGMELRTCDVAGLGSGLACWYVDPARAEGSNGWRAGTYDPTRTNYVTPLPKPFYVIRANGREHRYWIKADTGYDIGITAHKRVTANARTAGELVWERSAALCDRTAGRGECTNLGRVASTPWGPRSADPIGGFDSITAGPDGRARVVGWALDPDTNDPIDVHFYVNGGGAGATSARVDRPDVASLIPGYGRNHGFDTVIPVGTGTKEVCAYAINVGPYGTTNPVIGCRTITIVGNPIGSVESVTASTGGVRITGWALDADTTGPLDIHVYANGGGVGSTRTVVTRNDVAAVYPGTGNQRGYDVTVPTAGGSQQVCAYAINVGQGTTNPLIGCGTVTVSGDPFGNLEAAYGTAGGVTVSGWALDPDVNDAAVQITVGGAPVGTIPTDVARPDVGAAYPGRGAAHGFSGTVRAAPGTHQVCATAVNQGVGTSRSLGCRSVTVGTGNPFGNYEAAQRTGAGVRISGWALDPDSIGAIPLHVYVNGGYAASVTADTQRPDVGWVYPGYGPAHGFDATVPAPAGASVCVFAINAGPGTANPLLGCRTA